MVGVTLDRSDVPRRPHDARLPLRRVLFVSPKEVGIVDLCRRRPRVREAALRDDPLVDPGVGVRDLLLRERAARATDADRVAQGAVLLDQTLLCHHQRLCLRDDVAVAASVVERGRQHREAAADGVAASEVGHARSGLLHVMVAAA